MAKVVQKSKIKKQKTKMEKTRDDLIIQLEF